MIQGQFQRDIFWLKVPKTSCQLKLFENGTSCPRLREQPVLIVERTTVMRTFALKGRPRPLRGCLLTTQLFYAHENVTWLSLLPKDRPGSCLAAFLSTETAGATCCSSTYQSRDTASGCLPLVSHHRGRNQKVYRYIERP